MNAWWREAGVACRSPQGRYSPPAFPGHQGWQGGQLQARCRLGSVEEEAVVELEKASERLHAASALARPVQAGLCPGHEDPVLTSVPAHWQHLCARNTPLLSLSSTRNMSRPSDG